MLYPNLAKVGVEGSSPFARSRFFSNRQSLTKARHVSGLFLSFPAMRSDGHGDSAISRRGSRCDDVNSRRENLPELDAKQCPIPHRSVRKKCIE
jgi:hypothetical protein